MRSKTGSKIISVFLALFMTVCTISGVQASVDNNDIILTEEEFSSNRLLVSTTKKAIKGESENIIAQNDNVYLLQYDSPEETIQAYEELSKKAEFITPDYTFGVSANDSATDENSIESYDEDRVYQSVNQDDFHSDTDAEMTDNENPIAEMQAQVDSDNEVLEEAIEKAEEEGKDTANISFPEFDIALIDTGIDKKYADNDTFSVSMFSDDNIYDNHGHGTAMYEAILSQNKDARVLSIKAMNDNGYGSISTIYAAVQYAIERDVKIINLSISAVSSIDNKTLECIVEEATDKGIIVIGAAGNDGKDAKDYVPGNIKKAIIVGSSDESGVRRDFSNYGETVDYNIVSTSTSQSAAFMSGWISVNYEDYKDSIKENLNMGLIFETDYVPDENTEEITEEKTKEKSEEVTEEKPEITTEVTTETEEITEKNTEETTEITQDTTEVVNDNDKDEISRDDKQEKSNIESDNIENSNGDKDSENNIYKQDPIFYRKDLDVKKNNFKVAANHKEWGNTTEMINFHNDLGATLTTSYYITNLNDYTISLPAQIRYANDIQGWDGTYDNPFEKRNTGVLPNGYHSFEAAGGTNAAVDNIYLPYNDTYYGITDYYSPYSIRYNNAVEDGNGNKYDLVIQCDWVQTRLSTDWTRSYHHIGVADVVSNGYANAVKGTFVATSWILNSNESTVSANGLDGSQPTVAIWQKFTYKIVNHGGNTAQSGPTRIPLKIEDLDVSDMTSPKSDGTMGDYNGSWVESVKLVSGWGSDVYMATNTTLNNSGTTYGASAGTNAANQYKSSIIAIMQSASGTSLEWWGTECGTEMLAAGSVPKFVDIDVKKSSGKPSITNENDNYSLAGAVYAVFKNQNDADSATESNYKSKDSYKGSLTTNINGTTGKLRLADGTYYVKEVIHSPGYTLDTTTHTASPSGSSTIKSVTVSSSENPVTVTINLNKSSGNSNISKGSNYSLAGAVYTVYKTRNGDTLSDSVGTITTNVNGVGNITNLPLGTYYLKETARSKGFKWDTTIYTVNGTDTSIATNGVISKNVASTEPPASLTITLKKSSSNSSVTNGNNNYSLSGAVYAVFSGINDKTQAKADADSATIDNYDTKSTYLQTITTDTNGNASVGNLPIGAYYLKEISPSKGFLLDLNTIPVSTYESVNVNSDVTEAVASTEPYKYVNVSINKLLEITGTSNFAGAKFTLTPYTGANSTGTAYTAKVVDYNGTAVEMPLGSFTIKETTRPTDLTYGFDPYTYCFNITEDTSKPVEQSVTVSKSTSAGEQSNTGSGTVGSTSYYANGNTRYYTTTITIKDPKPVITTSAVDGNNATKFIDPDRTSATVKDTVAYSGLQPNTKYIIQGQLVDYDTNAIITTASTEFTTGSHVTGKVSAEGSQVVTFNFDASAYQNHRLVVLEEIHEQINGSYSTTACAEHKDKEDAKQTLYVPYTNPSKSVDRVSNDIGRNHTWTITTRVPRGISVATTKSYIITDVIDDRLSYTGNVVIKLDGTTLTNNTDYTLSQPTINGKGGTLIVTFTTEGLAKITAKDDITKDNPKWITIAYTTYINQDAVMTEHIPNSALVTVKLDTNFTDEQRTNEPYVYTGDLDLIKTDSFNHALSGAKYQLFEADNSTPYYIYENGVRTTKTYILTSGSDGKLKFHGVQDGVYYIKELEAPVGQELLKETFKIEVKDGRMLQNNSTSTTSEWNVRNPDNITLHAGGNGNRNILLLGSMFAILGFGLIGYSIKKKKRV